MFNSPPFTHHTGLLGVCDRSQRFGARLSDGYITNFQILVQNQVHGVILVRRFRTQILAELRLPGPVPPEDSGPRAARLVQAAVSSVTER
jgi:hypothetical protein